MKIFKQEKHRTIFEATDKEINELKEKSINDPWKPRFHIHPEHGLLNDPNGLAYYNGKYHVFHQWYPFGVIHGMKHWAHLESCDLVNWNRLPVAITPEENYESHGAYSGTSIEIDGKLYLYYTGNIKFDNINRSANQCLAIMDEYGQITKHKNNPLILGVPDGYTGHVRDPKVFKKNDIYYMLLGAQRLDETGTIIVYKSNDGIDWSFIGELILENFDNDFGYMWECPDYINIDGRDVLIFSPQGISPNGNKYNNIFSVIYLIGELDIENLKFKVEVFDEFESGFDFYAPQSFNGKRNQPIVIAWAGMGEFEYPTDKNLWSNCLTFPRELSIKGDKLIQNPVKEIELLRDNHTYGSGEFNGTVEIKNTSNVYELELEIKSLNSNEFGINLLKSDKENLSLKFNKNSNIITLDRSNLVNGIVKEYGDTRSTEIHSMDIVNIRILVDNSIVEIFINNGENVFTTRVFPLEESIGIELFSDNTINYKYNKYYLKSGIKK